MLKGKGGMLLTRAWGRGMGTLLERAVKEELVFVSKQRYCLCSGVCLARESDAWIFFFGAWGSGGSFLHLWIFSKLLSSGTLVGITINIQTTNTTKIYATLPASLTMPFLSFLSPLFSPFRLVCTQEDICSSVDRTVQKLSSKSQRYVIEQDPSDQR